MGQVTSQMPVVPATYDQPLPVETGAGPCCVISIPDQYRPDSPVPLVLVLHDDWDHGAPLPPFYGKDVLLDLVDLALSDLGAIVVAPDCQGRDWMDPPAEAAVLALVAYMQEVYCIAPGKTLVTGFGLGGAGVWHLLARHPDLFSTGIPIAGWPPKGTAEAIQGVSLYVINSRDDEKVPLDPTEAAVQRLRTRGVLVEFVALEGVERKVHEWDWVERVYKEATVVEKVGHQDFRFIIPLSKACPWVQSIWAKQAEST